MQILEKHIIFNYLVFEHYSPSICNYISETELCIRHQVKSLLPWAQSIDLVPNA
jgi:hypothetical protein